MSIADQEFLEELEKHPTLKSRFKAILLVAANKGSELITLADDAELQVIEQMRKLGQETLQDWADNEANRISNNVKRQIKDAKKHVKKNSGGTQPMEK